MKKIQLTLFMMLLIFQGFAQSLQVKGKVSSSDGTGIPGVSVTEKGTSNGSVTSADGVKKVFTASSSTDDGYYKFVATGFTFSTNNISVKLVSKSASTSSAQPSTITCIKGKVLKKVTAIKPKCPTGYKKK
mgnify:CR=1 FL=1